MGTIPTHERIRSLENQSAPAVKNFEVNRLDELKRCSQKEVVDIIVIRTEDVGEEVERTIVYAEDFAQFTFIANELAVESGRQ